MKLNKAIEILKAHQLWRLGKEDAVKIEFVDLTEAIHVITEIMDPKLIEGTTPNAWDMHFRRKLQGKLGIVESNHISYNKHYSEGLLDGFEMGAEWVWNNFKLEIK